MIFFASAHIHQALLILFLVNLLACGGNKSTSTELQKSEDITDELIQNQKDVVRDEAEEIDAYVIRRGYKLNKTETGLRYMIYKKASGGQRIEVMDEVEFKYSVSLLSGETVYSSDSTGNMKLIVGRSDMATGLQEGLQLMALDEKALFIIPSHLGYGLTGDGDRIRNYQTMVVDVEVVKVVKSSKQ
jgi:FKBP-type peptidyl-prolyl cis-trans isomerase